MLYLMLNCLLILTWGLGKVLIVNVHWRIAECQILSTSCQKLLGVLWWELGWELSASKPLDFVLLYPLVSFHPGAWPSRAYRGVGVTFKVILLALVLTFHLPFPEWPHALDTYSLLFLHCDEWVPWRFF